jgi:hypothetical protein
MTHRIAALAVALLAAVTPAVARAQAPRMPPEIAKLSQDKPVIELVTMGVGSLIWERHGHIALCVRYDDPRDDRCYNYGIGDFQHPIGMAWGFFRAAGAFWVGEMPVNDMMGTYVHADRTVWVQPLPLTPDQKQRVIAKLKHDILPANRAYAYDHFWDNCTTRVRNILDDVTGGKLSSMTEPTDARTYRDLAREGFFGVRIGRDVSTIPLLITDVAMGRATDRVPTYYERMFLPQYLREAVTALWHVEPVTLYERRGEPQPTEGPSGRGWLVLWILGLTSPAWITRWMGWLPRLGLGLAIAPYVLLGALLSVLAVISPLPYVRWNETCLVWLPLDLLLVVLTGDRLRRYALARLAMIGAIAALGLVGVFKQPLLAALLWPAIPLAVAGLWPDQQARIGQAGQAGRLGAPAAKRPGKRR